MKHIALICWLFLASQTLIAQDSAQVVKKVSYPAGFTEQLNVVYSRVNGWEGKLDLYLPPEKNGSSPLVINIHGGGWNKGNKESQTGFGDFFKRGYAVANIAYRLTGVATAPAAVEDTRCALIYLISNAKKLNINPNKIVIMGGSAGGHLALMGGLLENDHIFDTNCKGIANIKVAAIIDKYGITDVWDWGYGPIKTSKSATAWLGEKAKDKDFAMSVSPLYQVKKTSPPVFIVHGDADPIVPYQQSVALKAKLDQLGVKNEFITVKGGLHGKFSPEDNRMVNAKIMDFLKGLGL
ncbi:acetyl esterase/lipase [Pedobacter africanus]|uniref:Acetyl esterase/lipase n=1 Tax=Pedobacter africanus TaxID=151894 RepID=A0ACC6L0U9_9SPHI|nr:alpha/beta hydrolase [Pedobacter africanus]MDR6785127.1 acetyl esterase/lipase [Pedobacter africanus]